MDQVISKLRDVDPNNSDAVKDVLSAFFQNLIKQKDVHSYRWLRTLDNILHRFPRYCVSHRNTIETFLSHFSDSSNIFSVIEAAKCAHSLQQVRPTQEKTATAKVCWREHQFMLCNIAHKLIGALFPNSVDMYKGNENGQKLQMLSTPNSTLYKSMLDYTVTSKKDNLNKQQMLCIKLRNVFVYLQAMLVEIYPVAKPIQPQLILELILRALSVSSSSKISLDDSSIATIKIQALRTLDALSVCLGSNLIPYSALIFKVAIQTLRWSSENPSEESREVRCAAYASLSGWLKQARCLKATAETELSTFVVADISPPEHAVQLTMSNQSTRHLSKKAKRKLANNMLQESTIASHMPGEKNKLPLSEKSNDKITTAALEFTETFFTTCGIFLKPEIHKLFREVLVRECYRLDPSLDSALYWLQALESLRRTSTVPPTEHCLQLYSQFAGSKNDKVSKFCSRALLDIRLHLHCAPPTLSFVSDVVETRTAEKRKKLSDKNRAALKSLAGHDCGSDSVDGEVIDISEEPDNKKARMSPDVDRISLSSDSVESTDFVDEDPASGNDSIEVSTIVELDETRKGISNGYKEIELCVEESGSSHETLVTSQLNAVNDSTTNIYEDKQDMNEENVVSDDIHDAKTQMPLNASNDTGDGERSPVSMEVVYDDFSNKGNEKVAVLERTEDENLPSTNDTDDIQITCGQLVKSSQDVEINKCKEFKVKENGEIKVNDDVQTLEETKIDSGKKDATVEDMMADFVDEVIES